MRSILKERLDKLTLLVEEALLYKHDLDYSTLLVDILFIRHNCIDDLYTYDVQEEWDQEYCDYHNDFENRYYDGLYFDKLDQMNNMFKSNYFTSDYGISIANIKSYWY